MTIITGNPDLLVEVVDAQAVDDSQVTLPAELVPIFCETRPSTRPDLVVAAATPSSTCTWRLAIEGQGARVGVSTSDNETREYVTSTSLVPMALAAWLDIVDRGPAPPFAKVFDVSSLMKWDEVTDDIDGLVVTIARPDATALTVIARAQPTGYFIGVALEEQRQILLVPANGCDVWLRLSDLATPDRVEETSGAA